MSSDKENEYFSDGITEEIINALTKVEGLSVIARSSAFSFKGQDFDLREVGIQLGVAYILEGSVRKAGNKVRVTAQLIKASDAFNVFSEVYDRELQDIFKVQDDISNKIVQKFTDNIGIQKAKKKLVTSSTENLEAYELYLKGRFNLYKGSLEATKTAIQYFEAASLKDEKFVLPVAGLAACYTFLGGSGSMSVAQAFSKAKEYAQKTNALDNTVAETHLALATSSFWCDWDFENCGKSIKKAIQLSPGTSSIHGFNSMFLMATGKLDEALIEAQLAAKLDPLSLKSKFHIGELYFRSERFIEAIEIFDDILSENSFFMQASIFKAWSHIFLGDLELAINIFSHIPVTMDEAITFYGGLAFAYYKLGRTDRVLECLQNLKSDITSEKIRWLNYHYTLIFRALDETEKMFEYLEKCLVEKNTPLIFINVDPVWNEFRGDPKFVELIEKSFVSEKKDRIVFIKTDTKEELKINLKNLLYIEAQENYSKVVWIDDDRLIEKLLRVTLKNIEGQIVDSNIVRCHRSFIINANVKYTILGNSNGYRLKSKLFQHTIPISRSLGKEIVGKLKR
ncbi:MAG: LytTR family transcriptional regulator DNA-binding domain-containing protein, partial [Bacteroidales bacterium]|nr:LytTR family transcriptional regulator DNA-binding domain-containing protein [Bacteroidales bacterium]